MKRIVAIGALTTFALLSCNDSNRTPAEPSTPIQPSTRNVGTARHSAISDHKIKLPAVSAAALAQAEKADLATAELTTTTTTDFADHDPTVLGLTVRCFDGHTFGFPPGDADPFRPQSGTTRGCEITTMDGGAAAVQPTGNSTRGKLVRNVRRLEFYYAGGPQLGGAPRFVLFTDYCRDAAGNPVTTMNTPCTNDGTWDETLAIDQSTCNDGDPYVGAVLLKSIPNSASNTNCPVNETYGFDGIAGDPDGGGPLVADEHVHANWFAYIGAHPRDRFALNTGGTSPQRLDNFIIADVPVHFLIYRVRMQGGST